MVMKKIAPKPNPTFLYKPKPREKLDVDTSLLHL